ncbi:MAG TPA: dTMP kinase [Candidatus Pacearchaeota archaeon]|nr:dTMP kinase [Candidatus Pacearchaeota archaeon]HPR80147.1 dTMP kinase [Candidatus Pacearchaeota archaeon]
METKGKFIVIEGIEGCGKGTQTKFLSDFLSQKGYDIIYKKYPEYGFPIGDLLDQWLHKKFELNVESQVLLFIADFMKDKQLLENSLKSGKIVIADRYFAGTLIYQHINGFNCKKTLELFKFFDLKKPDLVIYIKISPEESFKRKIKQKGIDNLDRHEKDKEFLNSLYQKYEQFSKNNVFCEWTVIDGEKKPEEVFKNILEVINKKLGI